MTQDGGRNPSKGMARERAEVRRRLGPPYRYALGLAACILVLFALFGLLRAGLFPDRGKAGLIFLVLPAVGLWCLGSMLWWPFSRPALKRRLAQLESVDRLSELPDWPANRKAAVRAASAAGSTVGPSG